MSDSDRSMPARHSSAVGSTLANLTRSSQRNSSIRAARIQANEAATAQLRHELVAGQIERVELEPRT